MSASAGPPAGIRIGTVLDRYEIVRHVATGGMGSVWLGRMTGKHGFTKDVAIKTIAPEYAENPQFHAMFLEEARISSKLAHANVAQVLDVGEHQGGVFIVFEWVEGRSLAQICAAHEKAGVRTPLTFLLRVLGDACAGLHAAHELVDDAGRSLGVVHRDVTPANVLVSAAGFAKVIDFGIAKARDRVAIQTRAGYVKGTPEYMSPEQATRGPVDRRADVWSLGAVLFRGLAGAPPFRDRTALVKYIEGSIALPALPDDVPADVASIVSRALRVDARDRFAAADDMRLELGRALHAGTTSSGTPLRNTGNQNATVPEIAALGHDPTAPATPALPQIDRTAPTLPPPPPPPPPPDAAPAPKTLVSAQEDAKPEPPSAPHATRTKRLVALVVVIALVLAGTVGLVMMVR